jgi:hypothetical protein
MAQVWADSDMASLRHLLFLDTPAGMGPRFAALVFLSWAMIGIILTYIVMLIVTVG